nr:aldehyde dehydrogenase family protein [uncultured Holophaga sp.]
MYVKPNIPKMAHVGKTLIGFNWVGGRELEGDLPSFDARSSADRRDIVGIFPECSERDVARAAKAAAEAFKTWKEVPAPVRGAYIQRIGEVLSAQKEKLARIIVREIGKPMREALGEVQEAIDTCHYFHSEGRRLHGQTIPSEMPSKSLSTYRRPLGVVGVLASSNFPLAVPSWKIIPAILCGNTVVWKPSEKAPTIAYLFVRAMMDAGLPAGVVNTVNGRGHGACGKGFMAGIDKGFFQKVSFTGSTAMGRSISEACGRNLVSCSLELGGKNPMIVMPDADLDLALEGALTSAFATAGQRCTSLGNLILHKDIAEPFKARLLEAVSKLSIGNPTDQEVFYGPMINARFAKRFEEHWEMGMKEGATLLTGGAHWNAENRDERVLGEIGHGAYMQPCVWEGVTPEMQLFQQEVFGPTVNLCIAEDFDHALSLANGTPYGLSSALYTENRQHIDRFKRGIQAGMSSINNSTIGAEAHMPFGGVGWSGTNTREGGLWVLEHYTRWHGVNEDYSGRLQLAQIDTDYSSGTKYETTDWNALG